MSQKLLMEKRVFSLITSPLEGYEYQDQYELNKGYLKIYKKIKQTIFLIKRIKNILNF